jgi:hypothetical protein
MGALSTALLASFRYRREAVKCFWLSLILAGAGLLASGQPLEGLRKAAADVISGFAAQSILVAIPAAAIGFAAAIMLMIIVAAGFVAWHRFLIFGEEPRSLPGLSAGRCLAYGTVALATGFAVLVPFVVVAVIFTLSFVPSTGQGLGKIPEVLAAWFTSWVGIGTTGDANSIDVLFQDHLLELPYISFDAERLASVARMGVVANLLAYCLAGVCLYAGSLLLVRIAAGNEAPRRPPWFAVGATWNFLAFTIAWLPALLAAELSRMAIHWDGMLALLAPLAYAVSLVAALFTVSFVAAVISYLYAGDPWRYRQFYGLD